jgi:NADH dehydrogenase
MNVLVVGGSGFIGKALCAELKARGHNATAMSRNPGTAGLPKGVEKAVGDVRAYDSIRSSFDGKDVVVNLVALSPLFRPKGGLSHREVHLQGTENVVEAATDAGVGRIVQMSALGADPDGPTEYIRTKGQAERVVRDSGLEYTTFRPSVVFGDGGEFVPFTKKLAPRPVAPMPGGGETKFQPVWVGDLVGMLADAVENEEGAHTDAVYEIGGPEVLTLAEVTEMAYRAEGKSITLLPMPMSVADLGLGLLGAVGGPMGPDQARSLRMDNVTTDNDIGAFGVEAGDLTTLGQYLGLEAWDRESADAGQATA